MVLLHISARNATVNSVSVSTTRSVALEPELEPVLEEPLPVPMPLATPAPPSPPVSVGHEEPAIREELVLAAEHNDLPSLIVAPVAVVVVSLGCAAAASAPAAACVARGLGLLPH